ncbi:MAG: methyltransferase dimerization domain-containing protein, partial [Alphaproteobacteria bacterium]|nr:methyltransferase dimerization domain-containing protein [Alphaproteobacteria bacterium]
MSEARVDTVRLQTVVKGFWESAALMSGVELGLFTAISEGKNTVEAAAAAMGIEAENAERLMTALTAMTLLQRDGDSFTNAPDVERFLVRGKPSYAGPWMLFGKPKWGAWGELTERLRLPKDLQRVLGMYDDSFTVEKAREYHEATYSIGMGAARWFHKQVDLTGRKRIMDLGGGGVSPYVDLPRGWRREHQTHRGGEGRPVFVCDALGLRTTGYLMVGLPHDSPAALARMFGAVKAMDLDLAHVSRYEPLPSTV